MTPDRNPAIDPNPYASPAEAAGYDPLSCLGVGLWRDGKYLVLHPQAAFPPICIRTGEPADRTVRCNLAWYYPIDWSTRRLSVQLPFSNAGYRGFWLRRMIGLFIAVAAIGTMFVWEFALTTFIPHGFLSILAICGLATGVALRQRPLQFVRVRSPYLWYSGVSPKFLAQLPPWKFGS